MDLFYWWKFFSVLSTGYFKLGEDSIYHHKAKG